MLRRLAQRSVRRSFATTPRVSLPIKSGQALHETRPHRIQAGDITPGIAANEYFARRQSIFSKLPDNSLLVVPGNELQFASQSVFYQFRQDPNFQYLTGFLEPNSAVLLYRKSASDTKTIMFVPERDARAELWDGDRAGTEGARDYFNADEAYSIDNIASHVSQLVQQVDVVYADLNESASRFPRFFKSQGIDILPGTLGDIVRSKEVRSAIKLVEQSRLFKSEEEIDVMRAAAELSSIAYNKAFKQRFATEAALQAFLEYEFKINGCEESGYVPVVAGGAHALTIHYVRNDDVLRDGELVLVDAGGRLGGYCADISRTWPVNGRFTDPQRDLYQAVLNVEKKCIELCTEKHGVSFDDIHRASEDYMYTELLNAGMTTLSRHKVRQLYPHYIGHHLGLDVHDLKTVSRFEQLRSNQVITIEPGVYVPESPDFPKHFHNIGIRIEDNVVVGPQSFEVLTTDTAKEIEDIENF